MFQLLLKVCDQSRSSFVQDSSYRQCSPQIYEERSQLYAAQTGASEAALLRNASGVEVRPVQGLDGFRFLDKSLRLGAVFDALVLELQTLGYKSDVEIQSAPYDW
jgi:hypothetical protein